MTNRTPWETLALEAAWCVRVGKDASASFLHSIVAQKLTIHEFTPRKQLHESFETLPASSIDKAIAVLDRHGIVEVAHEHLRLNPERFVRAITRVRDEERQTIRQYARVAEEGTELICCTTCTRKFSLLEAVSELRSDERGFFCLCGGDMLSRETSSDERKCAASASSIVSRLNTLFAKIAAAEAWGKLPAARVPKLSISKGGRAKALAPKRRKINKRTSINKA